MVLLPSQPARPWTEAAVVVAVVREVGPAAVLVAVLPVALAVKTAETLAAAAPAAGSAVAVAAAALIAAVGVEQAAAAAGSGVVVAAAGAAGWPLRTAGIGAAEVAAVLG